MRALRIAVLLDGAAALDDARPLLRALGERGHSLHLAVLDPDMDDPERRLARFCADHPQGTVGHAANRADDWAVTATALRRAMASVALSPGSCEPPGAVLAALGLASADAAPSRDTALALLRRLHDALPCAPEILRGLDELDVDVVVLTDLERRFGAQADYLLAARELGLPAVAHDPQLAKSARVVAAAFAPDALLSAPRDFAPVTAIEAAAAAPWPRPSRPRWPRRRLELLREQMFPEADAAALGPAALRIYLRHLLPGALAAGARWVSPRRPLLAERLAQQAADQDNLRLAQVDAVVEHALAADGPVVFGPWLGPPDDELLLWIPFLTWLRKQRQIDKDRLIAVGQGGKSLWYAASGAQYVDVSELSDTPRQRPLGENPRPARAAADQLKWARRAAAKAGSAEFGLIRPEHMRKLYMAFLDGRAGPAFMADNTRINPLPLKPDKLQRARAGLPEGCLAVQFRAGPAMPDTAGTRALVEGFVRRLADQTDVLLLESPFWGDGPDLAAGLQHPRIRRTSARRTGDLSAQTLMLASCRGFVGSPGAAAYLAAQLGRTSLCLQAQDDPAVAIRLEWARQAFAPLGGRLGALPAQAAEDLAEALQALASPPRTPSLGELARAG